MKEPVMAKVARRFTKTQLPADTFEKSGPELCFRFCEERWVLVQMRASNGNVNVYFVHPQVMKRWSYFGAFLKRGKR